MKRGRQSSASLSVVPIDCTKQRPDPPKGLTVAQSKIWRDTVASTPAGWFQEGDTLLEIYCRHVATSDRLAGLINRFSVEDGNIATFSRLLAMRERETRMITHLATKMRLTHQAKMHPRTAARAAQSPRGPLPWD